MKTHWTLIVISGIVGTLIWAGSSWSQSAGPRNERSADNIRIDPSMLVNPYEKNPVATVFSKIDQIMQKLRSADESHKPELVKELEKAISEEFDADMKQREAELTKLEERVAKLRAQFERRKKAKGEITQLQTKVLVNEIDGLGFSHPQDINPNEIRFSRSTISPMLEGAQLPDIEPPPSNPPQNADPFSVGPQRAVAPPPAAMPPAAIAR